MIQILITTILILILQHNTMHILNIYVVVYPFENNPEILNTKGKLSIHGLIHTKYGHANKSPLESTRVVC